MKFLGLQQTPCPGVWFCSEHVLVVFEEEAHLQKC